MNLKPYSISNLSVLHRLAKPNKSIFIMINRFFYTIAFFISLVAFTQCSLLEQTEEDELDLTEGFITDFKLEGVESISLEIIHPEIVDGEEVQRGVVNLKVPYVKSIISSEEETSLHDYVYSLEFSSFNYSDFLISPGVGVDQTFSFVMPTTYTVIANEDSTKRMHYDVYLQQGEPSNLSTVGMRAFKLESAWNEGIETDVVSDFNYFDEIVEIFVPVGTDFTKLAPSMAFDGNNIGVRINNGEVIPYPESGQELNFKYPNKVEFVIENEDGSLTRVYRVLVDAVNPIQFSSNEIVLPNVTSGQGEYFNWVGTWYHQGNYPIKYISTSDSIEVNVPEEVEEEFNIFTAYIDDETTGITGNIYSGGTGVINVSVSSDAIDLGTYSAILKFNASLNINSMDSVDIIGYYWETESSYDDITLKVSTTIVAEE